MRKTIFIVIIVMLFGALALAACASLFIPRTGGSSQSAQQTQVMGTVSAALTQQAFETLVAQATQGVQITPAVTATLTVPVQNTPNPTVVVATPLPTSIPSATATQIVLPCNAAGFVKDVTIADGTEVAAGAKFTKTWRLVNNGTCTWTSAYDLVFVDGTAMGAPATVALTGNVRPGEMADLSVDMVAPTTGGSYKGSWLLRDENDKTFGLGGSKNPFWVSIKVSAYKSDAIPTAIGAYDFVAALCQATWKSNGGLVTLPCPNVGQNEEDWAAVQMNPLLEGKIQEDERAIWMHINTANNWMQAFYPAYTVKKNDHFFGYVGCLNSSIACDAVFSLDYRIDNGDIVNLGKWTESADGKYTKIDIDLSQFEGKNVSLILGATNRNASSAIDLFWMDPSIRNITP
jgi:hypothetical protein